MNASSDGQHNRELTALQYSRHDTKDEEGSDCDGDVRLAHLAARYQSLLTMRVMPLFDVFEDDGSGASIRNLTPLSVRRSGPPPSSIVTLREAK